MSTRSTLLSIDGACVYTEAFDESHIYLELDHCLFEASNNQVMVMIPIDKWEVLRQVTSFKPAYAHKTDEQILQEVTDYVDKRIAEIERYDENDSRRSLCSLIGFITFGGADSPREEQIAKGVDSYTQLRKQEQDILAKIEHHKQSAHQ